MSKMIKIPVIMNLKGALVLMCLGIATIVSSQERIDWIVLADVEFEQVYVEELGLTHEEATFGTLVSAYEGQEVVITGYVIPLDAMGISYALSRYSNANCFFCGGAGPETVLSLKLQPGALGRYKTDDYKAFKGVLQLNKANDKQFTYVLLDASPM